MFVREKIVVNLFGNCQLLSHGNMKHAEVRAGYVKLNKGVYVMIPCVCQQVCHLSDVLLQISSLSTVQLHKSSRLSVPSCTLLWRSENCCSFKTICSTKIDTVVVELHALNVLPCLENRSTVEIKSLFVIQRILIL